MAIESHPQPPRADPSAIPHEILVIGGSYAGLFAIQALAAFIDGKHTNPDIIPAALRNTKSRRGIHLTLVDERDGFFHTVGAPLAHASRPHADSFWKPYTSIQQLRRPDLSIRRGSVTTIDPAGLTATFAPVASDQGEAFTLRYDYLVLATGLRRAWPTVPRALGRAEYLVDAHAQIDGIEGAGGEGVVVIGGGAVGVEIAAEIAHHHPGVPVTLVHSRDALLSNEPLPEEFKTRARAVLEEGGVRVELGVRATVAQAEDGAAAAVVTLSDGRVVKAGKVVDAISRWEAVSGAMPAAALGREGYVRVNGRMSLAGDVPNTARHFAVGDVAEWSGIRRAGAAMAMGRIAATNVFAGIVGGEEGREMEEGAYAEFPEVPPMMALAVGEQTVTYGPKQGVKWGKELMMETFSTDLGWAGTLKHMGITDVEGKE